MLNLATLRSRGGSHVYRPFPSRLVRRAPDGHSAPVHQLEFPFLQHAYLVRLVESLQDHVHHGRSPSRGCRGRRFLGLSVFSAPQHPADSPPASAQTFSLSIPAAPSLPPAISPSPLFPARNAGIPLPPYLAEPASPPSGFLNRPGAVRSSPSKSPRFPA